MGRRIRTPTDHQVNALGLAGIVLVQEKLWLLGQKWLAILVVPVLCSAGAANHLLDTGTGKWEAIQNRAAVSA
jgi:hypothetical protein